MTTKIYGVVVGVVRDRDDPENEGRLQVEFPWMTGQTRSYWAPVARFMAGRGRGAWFQPEIGDEVLVSFEHGDVQHPFIIGFLWNGEDTVPEPGDPKLRKFRSVNGHEIAFYDPEVTAGDQGYLRVSDAHGNVIELANSRITIRSVGTVEIRGLNVVINGRPVAMTPSPI
ncbi:MAG: phage baseplate assembly protein V [Verrucomicrobia bacterium]|nr:phage baseplate assembly protein V [Verrucomicrobiota bacterium]